MYIVDMNIY